MNYETARAIALAAPSTAPPLPTYQGSTTDLAYLRDYVVANAAAFYGVEESLFDSATEGSTTLMRDWLHRALYQPTGLPYFTQLQADGEVIASLMNDVGALLRYPAYELCGGMAWQFFRICNALGWDANWYDIVNGEIDGTGKYTNSHVTVEIYLNDLGKYVITDPTYNFRAVNRDGTPLNFVEIRQQQYDGDPDVAYETFGVFHFDNSIKYNADLLPIDRDFFDHVFARVPFAWQAAEGDTIKSFAWITGLFPDWTVAHSGAGGTADFSDAQRAAVAVGRLALAGADWVEIATTLRKDGRYVSGFQTLAEDGTIEKELISVRLSDGSYVSFDITTRTLYFGSYDQIIVEATGGPFDRNVGDLTDFLGSVRFMGHDGTIFGDWTAAGRMTFAAPGADTFVYRSNAVSGANVLLAHNTGDKIDLRGFSFASFQQLMDSATYTANGLTLNLGSYHTLSLAGLTKSDLKASDFVFNPVSGHIPKAGVDVRTGHHLAGDFDGDGKADLIWRDANGRVFIDGTPYGTNHSFTWQVWGTGDVNGDGKDDFFQINNLTGQVSAWINKDTWFSIVNVNQIDRVAWNPAGLGDFDGNGYTDMLLRNTTTGRLVIHYNKDGVYAGGFFGDAVSYDWKVVGTGDFNGDGQDSILWRTDAGLTFVWDKVGNAPNQYQIGGVVNGGWEVAGVGDFNGDGRDDILWWKDSTGEVGVWVMNADGQTYGGGPTSLVGNPKHYIAGVGDVNGDGRDDIIWQDHSTGDLYAWLMDRRVVTGVTALDGPHYSDWFLA